MCVCVCVCDVCDVCRGVVWCDFGLTLGEERVYCATVMTMVMVLMMRNTRRRRPFRKRDRSAFSCVCVCCKDFQKLVLDLSSLVFVLFLVSCDDTKSVRVGKERCGRQE